MAEITKLKMVRIKSGIPQRAVAVMLRISQAAASLQEKRGVRTRRVATRYSRIFDCDPREILEDAAIAKYAEMDAADIDVKDETGIETDAQDEIKKETTTTIGE